MSCRIVVKSGLRSPRDDVIRTDDVMSQKVFDRCIEIVIRLLPGHVGCLRVELRVHLWNSDNFLNHLDRNVPLLDRRYVHNSVSVLHLRYLHSLLGRVQHRNLPLDHDGDVNNFADELQLRHLDGFLLNPRSCLDRRCHNVDQAVCSLAVLTFQRAGLVLASNVPHDDTEALVAALGGILFCDQLRGASRRTHGCRLRLCLVRRSMAPFEFLYSTVSALNPMTWIVITTSSDCESYFSTADSLSSRLSSYAPSILIASRTVSWLRSFLDEDPFGLFVAAVLPCEGLACRWHCSFTSCWCALSRCGCSSLPPVGPLFYSLQLGLLFCGSHRPSVSSTWPSSFVSSLLLATLPCELFHAFSSARSSRAVSQHAPSRAARGDRSRAWLLWISR